MQKLHLPLDEIWQIWSDCLKGEDHNSIQNQLTRMVWYEAIYRMVLESRRVTHRHNPSEPPINYALHQFIDQNFFEAHLSRVRKIIGDQQRDSLFGAKGVFSFWSLLKDIKRRQSEITRIKYFQLIKFPYDRELLMIKQREFIKKIALDKTAFMIPREFDVGPTDDAHLTFDGYSDKTPQTRSEEDVASPKFFESIENDLSAADKIVDFVNKSIAHAATPESRQEVNFTDIKIPFQKIWQINRHLAKVFNKLSGFLTRSYLMVLPYESANLFDYWDEPIIPKGNIDHLWDHFNRIRKETETNLEEQN